MCFVFYPWVLREMVGGVSFAIIKLIAPSAYQVRSSSSGVVDFFAFSVIGDYRANRMK
jgi:hypothetical protein